MLKLFEEEKKVEFDEEKKKLILLLKSIKENMIENHEERIRLVKEMIDKLMPNDFRYRMIKSFQENGEIKKKNMIKNLYSSNKSIKEIYNTLWEQQLDRRAQLVSLGNSTGIYRAVVRYLVGVPQTLLGK